MKLNSRTMNQLAKNPRLLTEFRLTGRLPAELAEKNLTSPLITLLTSIYPRDRLRITAVVVGPAIGYLGHRKFHSAAQALLWVKPHSAHNAPAESCRIKTFSKVLTIDDLSRTSIIPESIIEDWWSRHRHLAHLRTPTA